MESVEEVCWFIKTRCNRKVIANVIVFMIIWAIKSNTIAITKENYYKENYYYNYDCDYLKKCNRLQSNTMRLRLPQPCI